MPERDETARRPGRALPYRTLAVCTLPHAGRAWRNQAVQNFPQRYARTGGVLYLAIILVAFAEGFVSSKLIVPVDASATSQNILAASAFWRLSVAGNFVVVLYAVPLLWIEYLLLRPVSSSLILLGVWFNLVYLAVETVSKLFLLAVMPTLSGGDQLHHLRPTAARAARAIRPEVA